MILFYDRSNNNNRNFFFEESLKNSEVNVTFNKAVIPGKLWLNWHMTHKHDSYAWIIRYYSYQYAFEISCIDMQKSLGYWVRVPKQKK